MSHYIDEKITVWRRTWYAIDGTEEEIKKQLVEVVEGLSDLEIYDSEILLETEEMMTPEDNGGQPTIEIFNDRGETIWTNVPDNSSEKIGRDFDDHDSSLLYGIDNN